MFGSKNYSVNPSTLSLLIILVFTFYACGTYQSAYTSDDGIYSRTLPQSDDEVVVMNENEFKKNYFTYELEKIQEKITEII